MAITEDRLTEMNQQKIKFISFKELVEELCGVPFEVVYPESILENVNDKSDLE